MGEYVITYLVKTKVAAVEGSYARDRLSGCALGGHLLPRLVQVPSLAVLLPLNQGVDLFQRNILVNLAGSHSALEQSIHVHLTALWALAQELEDFLNPRHQGLEESIVV